MQENIPTKIIVHHSADSDPRDQLAKINEYHKSRQFPQSKLGYYVGYHYLINSVGKVTQTRELNEEGAHCKGYNFESIGICLEGNFDQKLPTKLQKIALAELLIELCEKFELGATDIYPHREFGTTNCFGQKLSQDWASMLYLDYLVTKKEVTHV